VTAETGPLGVVLTQVAVAQGLAAACALGKVPVDVVPSPIGAFAVCRDTDEDGPAQAAAVISQLLKQIPVVLIERRDGQVSASRWELGERVSELAPGLMLDGAPDELEDLMLGTRTVADFAGVVSSVGMSRWKALRVLAGAARSSRRARPKR
jgi:hypothetical protein